MKIVSAFLADFVPRVAVDPDLKFIRVDRHMPRQVQEFLRLHPLAIIPSHIERLCDDLCDRVHTLQLRLYERPRYYPILVWSEAFQVRV